MRIELTAEQQQSLLDWAGSRAIAENEADCEPAGYELRIAVSPVGCRACACYGTIRLELGDVSVDLTP